VRRALATRHARAGDLGRAETELQRALKIAGDDWATWRQLGLVRLLRREPADALVALRTALEKGAPGARSNHLLARAHLELGQLDEAAGGYGRALRAARARPRQDASSGLVDRLELESALLAARRGRLEEAVQQLEVLASRRGAQGDGLAARSLALARLKLGLRYLGRRVHHEAIRALAAALKPRGALPARRRRDARCALALALANAGQGGAALRALALARRDGGCAYAASLARVGPGYLQAFALYRSKGKAGLRQASRALTGQIRRARGAGKAAVTRLLRATYEAEAHAALLGDERGAARAALAAAGRLGGGGPALEHNRAVLDALDGRWAAAARVFRRLGSAPPQARIGLGLYHAQRGEQGLALRQLELARKLGLDTPWLREWIALWGALLHRCPAGAGRVP
jgi:tetratricopeptide (TPR) repeat protein